MTLPNQISSLAPLSDSISTVRTFHVSMLTDKEESEMHSDSDDSDSDDYYSDDYYSDDYDSDDSFKRIKFFKNETALSKDEQNYALSLCARRTFFLAYLNPYQEIILFDNWEKDMRYSNHCKVGSSPNLYSKKVFPSSIKRLRA